MGDMNISRNIQENFVNYAQGQGLRFDSDILELTLIRDSCWPFPKPEFMSPPY